MLGKLLTHLTKEEKARYYMLDYIVSGCQLIPIFLYNSYILSQIPIF